MKKILFSLCFVVFFILIFTSHKASAAGSSSDYTDVYCGVLGCPYITSSDNWAGTMYLSPNPISISSVTASPAKNTYDIGETISLNWSMFTNSKVDTYLAYDGYEIRYSLDDGNDWVANDCLNPVPGVTWQQQDYMNTICLDHQHLKEYPIYLTHQDDLMDSNGEYQYPVFDYRNSGEIAIPAEWTGKTVKFQIIEKFHQGVPDTLGFTNWYILTYSSSIKVAGDTNVAASIIKNICNFDNVNNGQAIYWSSGMAAMASVGPYILREYSKEEENIGQYDSYLPTGVTYRRDRYGLRSYEYNSIDGKIHYGENLARAGITYSIENHLVVSLPTFQISVNDGAFTDIKNYISLANYYGASLPITSFQKNGNYTIHAGDKVQLQASRKVNFKRCLEPNVYGLKPFRSTTDDSGNNYCTTIYDSQGISLGNRPLINYTENQTFKSNTLTIDVLPCMIKNVTVTPNSDTFKPNLDGSYSFEPDSEVSFKAEVEYEPFNTLTATCPLVNGTCSVAINDNSQVFSPPIKKETISNVTLYGSGWHFSTTLDKSKNPLLSFAKSDSSVKADDFDYSTWYFDKHYLAFEYKYLPEAYLYNSLSETKKNSIFDSKYIAPITRDPQGNSQYTGTERIENLTWPITATEAVGNSFVTDLTKYGLSLYNWPGSYHARAYVVLDLKEPSAPVTPPVTPPDQPQASGLMTSGLMILYDSNIVDNPPPGFSDLIAPNWGERVP